MYYHFRMITLEFMREKFVKKQVREHSKSYET